MKCVSLTGGLCDLMNRDDYSYDFALKVGLSKVEYNLLNFVAKVQNMSFLSYVEGVFKSIYDVASLSVSMTGMSFDEAIDDWNKCKTVQEHPELFVCKV